MFISFGPEIGYKVTTATSAIIGDSGKPQALYGYAFKSDGTAGVITFFDGTSGTGTAVFDDTGTVSATKIVPLAAGIVFTNGLFVSFDSHVTPRATFFVRQVIS